MNDWPPWLTNFHAFSIVHAATLFLCVAAVAASCYHGRCHRETPREAGFRRTWGWFVLASQVVSTVYWLIPPRFSIQESLPLQLCDLAGIAAGLAMLTHIRLFRTMLYFWGLCLSSWALLTPTLSEGPATLRFWLFWLTHLQIVGSAIYDIAVGGYRPNWRDYLAIVAVSLAYVEVVLLVNIEAGTNYGYLGDRLPDAWTPLNWMGPWPWRPVILMLLGAGLTAKFWLIWPITRLIVTRRSGTA